MPTKISTSAVGINAAFLQEVKEDNVMLHDLLGAASKVLDPTEHTPIQPRCMADLFAKLRDQLAIHFSLEEALGYLDDVIVQSPRLCEVAFELRAEHERREDDLIIDSLYDELGVCD